MEKKRIFVAIDLSEEARDRVSTYITGLRNEFSKLRVSWARPEKLHLTLKFIGDTDKNWLRKLERAVSAVAGSHTSIDLSISGTGVFPSARKPRVLWLGIKGNTETLRKVSQEIEAEYEKLGFAHDKREFSPHLTIARLREPRIARELVEKHLAQQFKAVKFSASELVLYESSFLPTGSVYSIVSKADLSKNLHSE